MTDWYTSFSNSKPSDLDSDSSQSCVFQRRNPHIVSINSPLGGTYDFWQYEERKLSRDEYRCLLLEDELTQTQLALTELYESLL